MCSGCAILFAPFHRLDEACAAASLQARFFEHQVGVTRLLLPPAPHTQHVLLLPVCRKARVRYDEYDSELDSDPDEEAKRKAKQNQVAALMQDTNDLDDEVEKVLGHRWALTVCCGGLLQSMFARVVCCTKQLQHCCRTWKLLAKLPAEVTGEVWLQASLA